MSFKCPGLWDNEPCGGRKPRSQAGKCGSKEAIDEVSISAPPQWEPTAMAEKDQYDKLLQFPQSPLDVPWGTNTRSSVSRPH